MALALIHLVASAACLGLGYAVARRHPWARLTQAILATLALVLIVAYAIAYTVSDAPRAGLVAIAGAAIVPAWVAYVLMSRTGASAFSLGDRDVTDRALPPRSRIPFLVRFMLGGILGLFVVGCLSAFFWVSVPRHPAQAVHSLTDSGRDDDERESSDVGYIWTESLDHVNVPVSPQRAGTARGRALAGAGGQCAP